MRNDFREVKTYLAHFGITGQKKGLRRFQSYQVAPTTSGMVGQEVGEAAKQRQRLGKIAKKGAAEYGRVLSKANPVYSRMSAMNSAGKLAYEVAPKKVKDKIDSGKESLRNAVQTINEKEKQFQAGNRAKIKKAAIRAGETIKSGTEKLSNAYKDAYAKKKARRQEPITVDKLKDRAKFNSGVAANLYLSSPIGASGPAALPANIARAYKLSQTEAAKKVGRGAKKAAINTGKAIKSGVSKVGNSYKESMNKKKARRSEPITSDTLNKRAKLAADVYTSSPIGAATPAGLYSSQVKYNKAKNSKVGKAVNTYAKVISPQYRAATYAQTMASAASAVNKRRKKKNQ